jgi:hypothetical protein
MSEEVAVAGTDNVEKSGDQATGKTSDPARLRIVERILFGFCGALLLIGFFLPWFVAGAMLSVSGLGLVFTSGTVVGMLAGANRFLLIAVPLLGAILLGSSILGYRVTRWIAVGGSGVILLFGFVILVRLFITSTGLGMWLVILSALLGLSIGLVAIGRGSSARAKPEN